MKTGIINARVDQSVKDRLEIYCQQRRIQLATIVEKALVDWLEAHGSGDNLPNLQYNPTDEIQTQQIIETIQSESKGLSQQMELLQEKILEQLKLMEANPVDLSTLNEADCQFSSANRLTERTEMQPEKLTKPDVSSKETKEPVTPKTKNLTMHELSVYCGVSEQTIKTHSTPKQMDTKHTFTVQKGKGAAEKRYVVRLTNYKKGLKNADKRFDIIQALENS
ncbi:MAG: hypothetical protein GVY17_14475 [Cyanobacteria bacterium]|jgi:hypothetical protein|nr:hypothetical protein [Cyanobacteria bacterium GSL.Bin21]